MTPKLHVGLRRQWRSCFLFHQLFLGYEKNKYLNRFHGFFPNGISIVLHSVTEKLHLFTRKMWGQGSSSYMLQLYKEVNWCFLKVKDLFYFELLNGSHFVLEHWRFFDCLSDVINAKSLCFYYCTASRPN